MALLLLGTAPIVPPTRPVYSWSSPCRRLAAADPLPTPSRALERLRQPVPRLSDYTEDAEALAEYLRPGQYTVAVGNPPYITVEDKHLNAKYRALYKTCSGHYSLSVPFVERFFELVRNMDSAGRAGIVGQITVNSFMKREFGNRLIEEYLASTWPVTSSWRA